MRLAYYYDLALPFQAAAPLQILKTASQIAAQGVAVDVLVRHLDEPPQAVLAHYGVAASPGFRLLAAGRPKDAAAKLTPYDVVMSRGEAGVRLFRAFGGSRPPFIYEAHRRCRPDRGRLPSLPIIAGRRMAAMERAAVEGCDGLVCVSGGIRDELQRVFAVKAPLLVLPSGTELPDCGPYVHDDVRHDIDLIYVGKFEERKGLDVALAALRLMPEVSMTLVGGEPEQVRRARARAGPSGRQLTLTGYVHPPEVKAYLGRARVGICPLPTGVSAVSERFTSPMKLLELMSHGVPAIASDVPSVRELIADAPEPPVMLVPPNDPAALASAVRRILSDGELAARLSSAGLGYVKRFGWAERARRLAAFAADVLHAAHRPEANS
ncbi:MAG: glycosyltransferase family 4 protein [Phycisphaerae bacterium]